MGLVVGIGGVSRSGKSTLASTIKKLYDHLKVQVLVMDQFVLPETKIPKIKGITDWETPESVDFPRLIQTVDEYHHTSDILIVEGILIYNHPILAEMFDIKLFVNVTNSEFKLRKKLDDRWEIPLWFIDHIWESYLKYGIIHKNKCQILNGMAAFDGQKIKNIINL